MATFLDLKNSVANYMGRSDGGSDDSLRDNMINISRREVFNQYKFSWLLKTDSLSVTSTTADMPSDYNPSHIIKDARIVVASGDDKIFHQIRVEDRDLYDTDSNAYYVFWPTYDSTNSVYVFNCNQTTATVPIYYYHLPADLEDKTDVEICPDPEAITLRAAAKLWMARERDETNHDRFHTMAEERLKELKKRDRMANPPPAMKKSIAEVYDLGYNEPIRTSMEKKGYKQ